MSFFFFFFFFLNAISGSTQIPKRKSVDDEELLLLATLISVMVDTTGFSPCGKRSGFGTFTKFSSYIYQARILLLNMLTQSPRPALS